MKDIKDIRKELNEVRRCNGYIIMFNNRDVLDEASLALVDKYASAIVGAPAKLQIYYRLYYGQAMKQSFISMQWGYSIQYLKIMSRELCEYFQKKFAY